MIDMPYRFVEQLATVAPRIMNKVARTKMKWGPKMDPDGWANGLNDFELRHLGDNCEPPTLQDPCKCNQFIPQTELPGEGQLVYGWVRNDD